LQQAPEGCPERIWILEASGAVLFGSQDIRQRVQIFEAQFLEPVHSIIPRCNAGRAHAAKVLTMITMVILRRSEVCVARISVIRSAPFQ